jgi:cation transport ATPase
MTEPAKPATPAQPARRSWLDRRAKIALVIAAVEGLLLLLGSLSKWLVIVVAIVGVALYLARGREMKPGLWKDVLWVVAVSQLLIILAAIVSFFIDTLILIVLGVFVAVALLLLFYDEPGRR